MRIYIAILLTLLLFCYSFSPISARADDTTPTAAAYVLMECETGMVLESQNAETPLPMGTLAKLMTVLLAAERVADGTWQLDTLLTAGESVNAIRGATVWLLPGESMTVQDLLKAVIIGNANDAAAVLADSHSGSAEAFVMEMNARAFDLKLQHTRFTSPQGYDDPLQLTTAYEMALLCRRLTQYDFLLPIFQTWRDFLRDGATELVNECSPARTYDGFSGWKASHTEESGYCAAMGAEREHMTCIAVAMGCADEDSRFAVCRQLLKTGFSQYQLTLAGFSDEFLQPIPVQGGVSRYVCFTAEALHALAVPKADNELQTVLCLPKYVKAPVPAGCRIGAAAFYNGKTLLYETPLITTESVEKRTLSTTLYQIFMKIMSL